MSTFGWLPLTSLALFNIVFSIGYGSVPFAVISEIFPPETKGVASSMSIVVHWSLVFAVTKLFPTMEYRMGQAATFWTFSCFTAASVAFAFFIVPETKGKTLQEIQNKLKRKQKSKTDQVEPIWKYQDHAFTLSHFRSAEIKKWSIEVKTLKSWSWWDKKREREREREMYFTFYYLFFTRTYL